MPTEPDYAGIVSLYFAGAVASAIALVVLLQLRPHVRNRLLIFGAAFAAGVYGLLSWLR
jgi:hypothetical protein